VEKAIVYWKNNDKKYQVIDSQAWVHTPELAPGFFIFSPKTMLT
jgi:hypothetical protein